MSDLKILWNSNGPFTPTGYGQQTGAICYRLLDKGYKIRVLANYGLEGSAIGMNNLLVYPKLFAPYTEDALQLVIATWKPDVFITLYDVWIGGYSQHLKTKDWFSKLHKRWIPYAPVDHFPIPDGVADQCRKAFKVLAMSRFGQKEFAKAGIKSVYMPHGVETKVFKPNKDKKGSKLWLEKHSYPFNVKKQAKIDADSFVLGFNMANKDPFRKDFGRTFTAIQIFLDQNPDAKKDFRFMYHGWMSFPGGFNLLHLANKLGITEYGKHTFAYDMYSSMPPNKLAQQYNAFDVFTNIARNEGFGIPIIEAMACGVPVIATDFTSMPELVKGHGWLIPPFGRSIDCPHCKKKVNYHDGCHQFTHLMSLQCIPDEWKIAEAIAEAYNKGNKRRRYAHASRKFSLKYDWDKALMQRWLDFLVEIESEIGMFGKWKGKDKKFEEIFKKIVA